MAELTCVVRDKNGKVLTDEELKEKVIDIDLFYKIMAAVNRRMSENEAS